MKIAIITINKPSVDSAKKLANVLNDKQIDIYTNNKTKSIINEKDIIGYEKLDDILKIVFKKYDVIIFILAIGAVVRKIAPFIKSKKIDPAVIVINLRLNRVIPLLSGHLGGANKLSNEICSKIDDCINFITTASDQVKKFAFDIWAKENGFKIYNLKNLANIQNRILNNQIIKIITYKEIFDAIKKDYFEFVDIKKNYKCDTNSVIISENFFDNNCLQIQIPLSIGIGCNKNIEKNLIQEAFNEFKKKYNLNKCYFKFASFEAKKNEKGLLEFIKENNFKIDFFTKDEINGLKNFSFSHSIATKFFQISGVAEPVGLLNSSFAKSFIKKEKFFKSITISAYI